tara:strand:+ start:625 stop:807 length:183 start_codon:yes stop_codon:yes gene_type:complete
MIRSCVAPRKIEKQKKETKNTPLLDPLPSGSQIEDQYLGTLALLQRHGVHAIDQPGITAV